jgi:predicted amidohydrolase
MTLSVHRFVGQTVAMSRVLRVAAAQLGPIARDDDRSVVVERLMVLMNAAARRGAQLVVFPELALTTFFARWYVEDLAEADRFYEESFPSPATQPLVDEARRLGVGLSIGYALRETDDHGRVRRWNVQTLIDRDGTEVATFKKVHIPGHETHEPERPFQHLERMYFEPSPDGFGVWDAFGGRVGMMICNDRRWPESYREMGLQGVELILCGYNTPLHYAPDPSQDRLQGFHNTLVMSAGAYQNGTFVVGVAKGGVEEGVASLAESTIFAPSGEVLARCSTDGDEVITADCDLDWCARYKRTLFDFERYRRPEVYHHLGRLSSHRLDSESPG